MSKKDGKINHSQYKLTSGIYIIFMIIILILVNLIANLFSFKVDFSANKTFSLSGEGKAAIDTIDSDIDIIVCQDRASYNGNIYTSNVAETLESMDAYAKNINVTFKSIDKNPEMAQEYPTTGLSTTSIIVRRTDDHQKYKVLNVSNLFETDTNTGAITSSKVEYLIISAMDYVSRNEFSKVCFVNNHVEDYPTAFASLLSGNNYQVENINLLTSDIDENTDYIMICNPKTDYSDDEIKKLDAFMQNNGKLGKNIYIFMSPEQGELPNLEALMAEWGIEVKTGYLYNTKYSLDKTYQSMLADFNDVQSAGNLFRTVQIVTYQTRPINLLFDSRDYQTTTPLLSTASGAQYVVDPDKAIDTDRDAAANAPILVIGSRLMKNTSSQSHMVVSGSYRIISDEYIKSTYGNSEYFMQIFNYFSEESNSFIIYPKNMEASILNFSNNASKTVLLILFIVVLPLLVAATGAVVYFRRRHL